MGQYRVMGEDHPTPSTRYYYHHPTPPLTTMTRKQLRDLQLFAVELAREGRHEAAREVLALIARG